MAQSIEFTAQQDQTLVMRLITPFTDLIAYTSGNLTGKANDKTLYLDTAVPSGFMGIYRVSVLDDFDGMIAYGGWVYLTGIDGALHTADDSYYLLLSLIVPATTQIVEFRGPQDESLIMRLIPKGTDVVAYASQNLMPRDNDGDEYIDVNVPATMFGFHRVSAVDPDGLVAYGGWVNLRGKTGYRNYADDSYYHLLKVKQKPKNNGRPRYRQSAGSRSRYSALGVR